MNRSNDGTDINALVTRLQSGDQKAFAVIYDNYHKALYGICIQVLQKQELAEDALQKSFVKIWKKARTYDSSKGKFYTWMLNICRNTAIDIYRSESRKQSIQDEEFNVHLLEHIRSTETNTDVIDLKDRVEKLEQKYSEVLRLSYLGGYTQKEISKLLQMPLGTVKTRMRTAIQQLRNIYVSK